MPQACSFVRTCLSHTSGNTQALGFGLECNSRISGKTSRSRFLREGLASRLTVPCVQGTTIRSVRSHLGKARSIPIPLGPLILTSNPLEPLNFPKSIPGMSFGNDGDRNESDCDRTMQLFHFVDSQRRASCKNCRKKARPFGSVGYPIARFCAANALEIPRIPKRERPVALSPKGATGLDDGGQGQNRTADTGIFSPVLYRLSYLPGPTRVESRGPRVSCALALGNASGGSSGGENGGYGTEIRGCCQGDLPQLSLLISQAG